MKTPYCLMVFVWIFFSQPLFGDRTSDESITRLIRDFYIGLQGGSNPSIFVDPEFFLSKRIEGFNFGSHRDEINQSVWELLKENRIVFLNRMIIDRGLKFTPSTKDIYLLYAATDEDKTPRAAMLQLPIGKNVAGVKQIVFSLDKEDDEWYIDLLWTSINGV